MRAAPPAFAPASFRALPCPSAQAKPAAYSFGPAAARLAKSACPRGHVGRRCPPLRIAPRSTSAAGHSVHCKGWSTSCCPPPGRLSRIMTYALEPHCMGCAEGISAVRIAENKLAIDIYSNHKDIVSARWKCLLNVAWALHDSLVNTRLHNTRYTSVSD